MIAGQGSVLDTRALLAVAGTKVSLVAVSGKSSAGRYRQQPPCTVAFGARSTDSDYQRRRLVPASRSTALTEVRR